MKSESNFENKMWRGAVLPSLVTGLISGLVVTIWRGRPGAFAALLAILLVFIFFSVHLLVAKISKNLDPVAYKPVYPGIVLSFVVNLNTVQAFILLKNGFTLA